MISTQVFPTCDANANFHVMGISSELTNTNPYLQFNSPHQFVSYGGLDTGMNPIDMGLKRSISAPVSIPETFIDSSSFHVGSLSLLIYSSITVTVLKNCLLPRKRPSETSIHRFYDEKRNYCNICIDRKCNSLYATVTDI